MSEVRGLQCSKIESNVLPIVAMKKSHSDLSQLYQLVPENSLNESYDDAPSC